MVEVFFFEKGAHSANIFVDVGDHAIKAFALFWDIVAVVKLAIRIGYIKGTVRCVGGHVTKEWLIITSLNKFHGFVEPDVGAISAKRFGFAVAEVGVVEVGVAPIVGGLVHATAAVVEGFVEATIVRMEGIVVAQVPFAKHAGAIPCGFEEIGNGGFVGAHDGASANGVPNTGAVAVAAGEEARTCGGTGGTHVVVGKMCAFGVEVIEVGGLDDVVAVAAKVAISLVVSDDKYDVGSC